MDWDAVAGMDVGANFMYAEPSTDVSFEQRVQGLYEEILESYYPEHQMLSSSTEIPLDGHDRPLVHREISHFSS